MTSNAAAKALGVTPGALKQLVEAKVLTPLRTRGPRGGINLYAEARGVARDLYWPDLPPQKWTGLSRSAFGLGGADIAQ